MNKPRLTLISALILAAATARLLPHPPNFTPIAAVAIFGGCQFADRRAAFGVPLIAMLLADLVIGFHGLMPVVYGCFALTTCLGIWLRPRRGLAATAGVVAAGAALFFVITNFANWVMFDTYPHTAGGLLLCYEAGVPFLVNQFLGDALFTGLLFGALSLAECRFSVLRENQPLHSPA